MDQGNDGHSQAQNTDSQLVLVDKTTSSAIEMMDAGSAQSSAQHTGTAGQAYRNLSDVVEFVRQVFPTALQELQLSRRDERTLRGHKDQFDKWYAGLRRQDGTSQVDYYNATARRDLTAVLGDIMVSLRNSRSSAVQRLELLKAVIQVTYRTAIQSISILKVQNLLLSMYRTTSRPFCGTSRPHGSRPCHKHGSGVLNGTTTIARFSIMVSRVSLFYHANIAHCVSEWNMAN